MLPNQVQHKIAEAEKLINTPATSSKVHNDHAHCKTAHRDPEESEQLNHKRRNFQKEERKDSLVHPAVNGPHAGFQVLPGFHLWISVSEYLASQFAHPPRNMYLRECTLVHTETPRHESMPCNAE